MIILSSILIIYVLTLMPICIEFFLFKKEVKDFESVKEKQISILIPVRNESDNILECLDSLLNQNYLNTSFEIIVINDHSTDDTVEKVNQFISNHSDYEIRLIDLEKETTKKKALRLGVNKSKYSIIATTDADCIVPRNWLKNINLQFEGETKMLTGPVIFKQRKGFLTNFQILDMLAIQGVEFGMLKFSKAILNNAANLAYKKESYNLLGGYDDYPTPSGDDIFLLEKFRKNNFSIKGLLAKDFIVETQPEKNFKSFIHQRLRWSSKTKYYKTPSLIYFGLVTILINISSIFIYIGLLLVEKYRVEMLFFLSCKWLIDFILLILVASFFERKAALLYFIPVQLVYPFYIVFIWIASLKGKYEWKGRKFNG